MLLRSVRASFASLLCLGALALAGSSASAAPIAVFSTGVTNSGALAATGSNDLHYTITAGPTGAQSAVVGGNLPSVWTPNTSTSQWIGLTNNLGANAPAGVYNYQTTFSLAGLVASSAVISGSVASDDVVTIILNGINKGTFTGYDSLKAFTLNSSFIDGVNTLIFQVTNSSITTINPTGLQVNIANASANAVPEPASALMLGLGGAAVAGFGLRRRRASV